MKITVLFTDIGEVILNNGWDIDEREQAIQKFKLQKYDFNHRHHLEDGILEEGKITLDEYLDKVIFYKKRSFTPKEFKEFMFSLSKPHKKMFELETALKKKYDLKVFALSNECRELNEIRIKKFELNTLIDCYISSCYVGLRKPDKDIFKLALDIAQVSPAECVYIDDQIMFTEVAKSFGMNCVHHTDYESTVKRLEYLGLTTKEEEQTENI